MDENNGCIRRVYKPHPPPCLFVALKIIAKSQKQRQASFLQGLSILASIVRKVNRPPGRKVGIGAKRQLRLSLATGDVTSRANAPSSFPAA